ncbi:Serine/threonine-protein kinase PrkC [Thalassocella blandensis]|nr:Serine/threonine-protein kinase PrkC [Thalassocella blandensis]
MKHEDDKTRITPRIAQRDKNQTDKKAESIEEVQSSQASDETVLQPAKKLPNSHAHNTESESAPKTFSQNAGNPAIESDEDATILKPSANAGVEDDATRLQVKPQASNLSEDETILVDVDKTFENTAEEGWQSQETKLNPSSKLHQSDVQEGDDGETQIKPVDNPHSLFKDLSRTIAANRAEPIILEPGTQLKNRFVLEKKIGSGGMGTIFLAKDLRKEELQDKDSQIVIKVLNDELHDNFEAVMSLQREAKKSQTLSHPNIVTVYDFDREDTTFFISMEYLQGESLDQFIGRGEYRTEKQTKILHYVELMARGLAFAHQEGFVHADFKPANVFLTNQGQIKILDFGIAQAVRNNLASQAGDETVFDPASLGAMTPNYASLEMLEYQRPVPADDVYALACVGYELLTGKHPYRDENGKKLSAKEAQKRNLHVEPVKGLSKRQMQALTKGLAFKREHRYVDAGQFIDAIKPRVKLAQSIILLIAALSVAMVVSWYMLASKSDAVIGFDDLPPSMAKIVDTIKDGDEILQSGDVNQAHKLYALAWESSFDLHNEDSRDLHKLKVIVDRRINKIIEKLISDSEKPELDEFSLMQLQLALEFLQKDELGSMDDKIDKAIAAIKARLEQREK